MTLLAGIDVGTTGVRCMIFDASGRTRARAYREYPSHFPHEGWVEHRPEEMLDAVFAVCREALATVDAKEVVSVGVSAQRSVLCTLDSSGNPTGNLISWQDARATEEAGDISLKIDPNTYYEVSGIPVGTTWLLPKILWLRKHDPERFEKTAHFVQVMDFVLHSLGADGFFTDVPCTVFYGLWDIRGMKWNEALTQDFGLSTAQFGTPTPAGTCVGRISPRVAEKTGFASGTALCLGAGDQNCATLGMGAIRSGMGTVTLGTCGMAVLSTDVPASGFGGMMITPHAVASLWEIEGLTNAAACAYQWFLKEVGDGTALPSFGALNALAASSPPGANDVLFLPYLAGAASPRWNAKARGAFCNLALATTRADMVRAVMEGVTFEIQTILQTWREAGYTLNALRIAGGATRSELWNQIQADTYGIPVQTLVCEESTCLAAALLGGVGVGHFASLDEGCGAMVHPGRCFEPNVANFERYQECFEKFRKLYQSLYL